MKKRENVRHWYWPIGKRFGNSRQLSDSVGNRKKATLSTFLRSLRYNNEAKPNSEKFPSSQKAVRATEREIIYDKCIEIDEYGDIDTMKWRLSTWSSLCLDSSSSNITTNELKEAEASMEREGVVDILFLNEAARRAFSELRGHRVDDERNFTEADVSIISLARADAAMTTMLKWIKVGGRGGVRNSNYNDCFRQLLPLATESIIKEIWDDLADLVPHEMFPYLQSANSSIVEQYGNDAREWTTVVKSPEDNYLYLLAKPEYFKTKVCPWLGCVKDCQVGRCLPTERLFTRIEIKTVCAELAESDVKEEDSEHSQAESIIAPPQISTVYSCSTSTFSIRNIC